MIKVTNQLDEKKLEHGCHNCTNEKGLKEICFEGKDGSISITLCEICRKELYSKTK